MNLPLRPNHHHHLFFVSLLVYDRILRISRSSLPSCIARMAKKYRLRRGKQIKEKYPTVPTVAYIKHSGALVERMAATGVDVVSLDWTVDMAEGRERIKSGRANAGLSGPGGVQGNLDPAVLFGDFATIKERAEEIMKKAGPVGHVMNLGHGIEAATPEENAAYFIETVRNYRHES